MNNMTTINVQQEMIMYNIEETNPPHAYRVFTIAGENIDLLSQAVEDFRHEIVGSSVVVTVGKRAHADELKDIINNLNATTARQQSVNQGKTPRYIELASVAVRDDLSHGKVWTCSAYDIDAKGAHPAWEGEAVCYVYRGDLNEQD